MNLAIKPELPGGIGTVALAVNMLPVVLGASPGLKTMVDLPFPGRCRRMWLHCWREGDGQLKGKASRGEWVQIHAVVLAPGERAPQVPKDTAGVPLEMRVKGFAAHDACVGEEVTVVTAIGRRVTGTLVAVNPGFTHGFARPDPDLVKVGRELRQMFGKE